LTKICRVRLDQVSAKYPYQWGFLADRYEFADYPSRIAGEIKDFDPTLYMEKREAKKVDRFTQLGVGVALQTWQDAGLVNFNLNRDEVGVLVGSGNGGIHMVEQQHKILFEKGPRRVSPFLVPALIANMASGYISMVLKLRGPNSTVVTACASSSHAIGDAWHLVRRGDAVMMLAGGTEAAISHTAFSGFCAVCALSTRNDEPEKASRSFDKNRSGG